MRRMETSVCTGCWRLALLSCVLALHLIPLSAHGNAVGTNATELDGAANATALLNEDEGPGKVSEAITAVTGMSPSTTSDPIGTVTPRAGRIPRAGEEEEQSSGMFGEAAVPTVEDLSVSVPPQLSPDSAETDHLLPSDPRQEATEGEEEEEEERLPHTDPPWIHAKDTAVFDLDRLFTTTAAAAAQPSNPTNPSNPDVLHVDFFDPSSRGRNLDLAPPSPSSLAHELQGGDATSWAMPENYDYLTPYEDGVSPTADEYAYSTTTDAYETDEDLPPGRRLPGPLQAPGPGVRPLRPGRRPPRRGGPGSERPRGGSSGAPAQRVPCGFPG
uniref:Uncharacterized protein n=1 Tax=Salarias fasciatus TaxID=181472 RepID=A0A672HBY1_SALFA